MKRIVKCLAACCAIVVATSQTADAQEPQPQPEPQVQPQPEPQAYPQPQPYPQPRQQAYPQAQQQPYPEAQPVYVVDEVAEAEGPGRARFEFFGRLGFAGTASLDASAGSRTATIGEADLGITPGFGVGFTFLPVRYFGIGGRFQAGYMSFEDSAAGDGILALDLAVVPRPRFPFLGDRAAVYIALPLGVSVLIAEESLLDDKTELAVNVGIMPGIEFFVGESFGLFFEIGYQLHVDNENFDGTDVTLTLGQATVALGGKLAF